MFVIGMLIIIMMIIFAPEIGTRIGERIANSQGGLK